MVFNKDIIEDGLEITLSDLISDTDTLVLNLSLDDTRPSVPLDVAHVGSTFGNGHQDQFAILSVWQINPSSTKAGNQTSGTVGGAVREAELVFSTDKFLLASASELRSSRAAPVFTFGQPLVFTAGRRPYIFNYSGHLLISRIDGDGRNQFYEVYDQYLRASANLIGSDRAQLPWIVELAFKGGFRRGYVTNIDIALEGTTSGKADFSFSLFVVQDGYINERPENIPRRLTNGSTQ